MNAYQFSRRSFCAALTAGLAAPSLALTPPGFHEVVAEAATLPRLRSLSVMLDGWPVVDERFHGTPAERRHNIGEASQPLVAALTAIAISKGYLNGLRQHVAPILGRSLPADPDPRMERLLLRDLLSMRSGLQPVETEEDRQAFFDSEDWVKFALARPFVGTPGRELLRSGATYHLLGAVLTLATGHDLLSLSREWLGGPLEIDFRPWTQDPQGRYLGGDGMALTASEMMRFAECLRRDGRHEGRQVLPAGWAGKSWTSPAVARDGGDGYGLGWQLFETGGHKVAEGLGNGGQAMWIVPDHALTVVATSDCGGAADSRDHVQALGRLVADRIIPAAHV